MSIRRISFIIAAIGVSLLAYWIITIKQAVDEKFTIVDDIVASRPVETTSSVSQQPNTADRILFEKRRLDSLLQSKKKNILVYVKVKDTQAPRKVINEQWPGDIESTYNILKNDMGQVVYFAEFPISESGDWTLELKHYFNKDGKTIVFEKRISFFNEDCAEGAITEVSTDLFANNFKLHATIKSLQDSKGNSLAQDHFKNCWDPYKWTLDKKGSADELLNLKKIPPAAR